MLGTTTAFLPGIAGGPLAWSPTVEIALPSSPHWLPTVACWSVALLVVGSAWRSRRARRAWVVCAGYVVGNVVLFALGRPNSGALFAQTRYWADPLLVFATCLALATMPLRLAPSDRTRALPRPWVHPLGAMRVPLFALVVVAVTTATVVSTSAFLVQWQRRRHASMADLCAVRIRAGCG